MGTKIQQPIHPSLLLQDSPNRFVRPATRFSFSQSQYHQPSSDNAILSALHRQPSQVPILLNRHYSTSGTGQLLQENFNEGSSQMNLEHLSSVEQYPNDR